MVRQRFFNSDQGSQFTSEVFTDVLKRERVTISMDGRGRAFDNIFVERLWRNVKHEDVYLNGYRTMGEANNRFDAVHEFLQYRTTPSGTGLQNTECVYETGTGGGAIILNKYGSSAKI